MRTSVFVASAVVLVFQAAYLKARDCRLTDEQFFKQLSTMNDWRSIYAVFKQNLPACPDDGSFAEGYTEVIVVALANRWPELQDLENLVARDGTFRQFVYRHIDATADIKDLRRVLSNAKTKCPTRSTQLCKDIATRAQSAIAQHP